jgi:DNA-directed RNA polymerase subunit RPC12/RpoP
MVSSEADKCPHCNTGRDGIRGVNCLVCGGLLKFSEARRITKGYYEYAKSEFCHDACYQQVTRKIVEKKQTINCPVCSEPNQFSYAQQSSNKPRSNYKERINCAKCGHPYEYQQTKENDPYTECKYCGFLLEKNREVLIKNYYGGYDHYAHKVCYTNERQAQELRSMEYHENSRKKIEEEQRLKKKKEAEEKFESKLRGALLPGLFMGGLSLAMGVWAILLFGILFGLYLIID